MVVIIFELELIRFLSVCIVGDYSHASGTLIGALFNNLGLSTRELSKDKDMDLRTHYSCWLSKPLPQDLPFGRLLCFEKLDILLKNTLVLFLHASLEFWRNYNLSQDTASVTFWHFFTKIHVPVKETDERGKKSNFLIMRNSGIFFIPFESSHNIINVIVRVLSCRWQCKIPFWTRGRFKG